MDQRSISMAKNKEQLFDALKQNYKNANKQDSERSFWWYENLITERYLHSFI